MPSAFIRLAPAALVATRRGEWHPAATIDSFLRKLGLGFAWVTGPPTEFMGINIRSPAEQLGQGRFGKKGWGILSVDGTLPSGTLAPASMPISPSKWMSPDGRTMFLVFSGDDSFSVRRATIRLFEPQR